MAGRHETQGETRPSIQRALQGRGAVDVHFREVEISQKQIAPSCLAWCALTGITSPT